MLVVKLRSILFFQTEWRFHTLNEQTAKNIKLYMDLNLWLGDIVVSSWVHQKNKNELIPDYMSALGTPLCWIKDK